MAPSQQKVLVLPKVKADFEVRSSDVPKPKPGQLLVKLEASALNPIDYKIQELGMWITEFPTILGCEAAGMVEELGEGVSGFAVGDRVFSQGRVVPGEARGTYQQYVIFDAALTAKIPDSITFDQAATIPLCLATAAIGLYHDDPKGAAGLYPPWADGGIGKYKGEPIVVLGGGSTVGKFAIQLAKLSGFNPIITTASPHNADTLQESGATHVLNRNLSSDALLTEIQKIAAGAPIKTVYDSVSWPDTQNLGYDVLAPGGVIVIDQYPAIEKDKLRSDKRVCMVFGDISIPKHHKLGEALYAKLPQWLTDGSIKLPRVTVEVVPGGLGGVVAGLKKLQDGVSNVKLVVHPQETA